MEVWQSPSVIMNNYASMNELTRSLCARSSSQSLGTLVLTHAVPGYDKCSWSVDLGFECEVYGHYFFFLERFAGLAKEARSFCVGL